jgi:hypothetical protein
MSDKKAIARCDVAAAHLARAYAKQDELAITIHTNGNDLRHLSVIFPRDVNVTSVAMALQRAGNLLFDGETKS